MQLTLTADLPTVATVGDRPRDGVMLRPTTRDDIEELGALYFESYPSGVAGATLEEATDDVLAAFDGGYGELWLDASLVATLGQRLVGAVQVVRTAPWPDVPDGAFIIELFVHPGHRRRGLARQLLARALGVLSAAGESSVALRVDSANVAALGLYRAMGFTDRS